MIHAGSGRTSCRIPGANDPSGVNGDQTKATLEMGKIFTDVKINLAVAQIKQLIADAK